MSKNIYRVNKKSDLDEIMRNNFYKPICIIFLSKLMDEKFYSDICTTLLTVSKKNTYNMTILIDFDNFIDNIDYFSNIKSNIPNFLAYFKGKNIGTCDNKDNFIPLIINLMEQIHSSYLSKLMNIFNQEKKDDNEDKVEIINNKENHIENHIENQIENHIENHDDEENYESEINDTINTEDKSNNSTSEDNDSNNTENIKKNKERLKKLKELKELKNLLEK